MSLEYQAKITVTIERRTGSGDTWELWPGLESLGTEDWENRTGGQGDSDATKHREGGMGPLLSHGGQQTLENVTVGRRYDLARDHSKIKQLYSARGRARMTVVEQPLDEFGGASGEPVTYQGKLKSVNPGDVNANSSDVRMVELELDTESVS